MGDGITKLRLDGAMAGNFGVPDGVFGMALNLEVNNVGAVS